MWTATRTDGSAARSATSAAANSHVSCTSTSGCHSATARHHARQRGAGVHAGEQLADHDRVGLVGRRGVGRARRPRRRPSARRLRAAPTPRGRRRARARWPTRGSRSARRGRASRKASAKGSSGRMWPSPRIVVIRIRMGSNGRRRRIFPGTPDGSNAPSAVARAGLDKRGRQSAAILRRTMRDESTFRVKAGLAEMLKGGVIMDVVDAEQAKIAEDAGAAAVMALERVPADIRRDGGVARMSDPVADQGHPGGRDDPRHGQGAHRPLRRGAGARVARDRLHRRVRGPHARRRGQPHRQVELQGPVRVRRHQPGRGAAPDRRGRGDDPLQGRGRHGRHRRGRAPHAPHQRRDQGADRDGRRPARDGRQGAPGAAGPGPPGRARRQAPGRAVLRRRHRHPGRRVADDAARRRGRVRRLGHLQVRGPRHPRRRDRRGDHPLRGPGRASRAPPRASAPR